MWREPLTDVLVMGESQNLPLCDVTKPFVRLVDMEPLLRRKGPCAALSREANQADVGHLAMRSAGEAGQ